MDLKDFKPENEDLYEILQIPFDSTIKDIKKAYRKQALKCHPDKNPDDKNAAAEFHKLSKILEILTDESARKAYDRLLKGRKEAAIRHSELDSKRRKLKEDLEAREKAAVSGQGGKSAAQLFKEEIDRLRKEGSKQVEEEMELMRKQFAEEQVKEEVWDSSKHRIKIKWKSDKHDAQNGGYTQDMLHRFLSKYGNITVLVMSPKKKGSALVEFDTKRSAEMAVDIEKGLSENPLELSWVDGKGPNPQAVKSNTIKETDFESITLMKLRQAEERKRLIEQMMAEDE
ncbi:dnaJ homolog subfamily C member 17 [Atheta coriaria]|uniref:dnaJ homolog subfamily C member 17 n=1 Tax=Dalotia coriaria TaxID=877792 RepID=UPI0031F444FF